LDIVKGEQARLSRRYGKYKQRQVGWLKDGKVLQLHAALFLRLKQC